MIFGKNIIYFVKLILYLIGKRTATTTVHFEVIHRNVGLICQNILHLLRVFFYSIRITQSYRVDSDYLSNITILIAILYINFFTVTNLLNFTNLLTTFPSLSVISSTGYRFSIYCCGTISFEPKILYFATYSITSS